MRGRRSGGYHSTIAEGDIGYMIGKQAVFASHDLPRRACGIEQNQAVRGGYGVRRRRHRDDSIDAEERVVFVMDCALQIRVHYVEPAIEVADPQAAAAQRQRCDVAVGEQGRARGEGRFHCLCDGS